MRRGGTGLGGASDELPCARSPLAAKGCGTRRTTEPRGTDQPLKLEATREGGNELATAHLSAQGAFETRGTAIDAGALALLGERLQVLADAVNAHPKARGKVVGVDTALEFQHSQDLVASLASEHRLPLSDLAMAW